MHFLDASYVNDKTLISIKKTERKKKKEKRTHLEPKTHHNKTRIGKAAGKECSEVRQDD